MMTDNLKTRISILSQLANVDGEFDIRELAFLYNVCLRNNVDVESIADIISKPEPIISLELLEPLEKTGYLTDILLMMMIDGKVLPKEIRFCLEIGERLGFDPAAIRVLIDELGDQTSFDEEYIKHRVGSLPGIRK